MKNPFKRGLSNFIMHTRQSSDMAKFRETIKSAKQIVILSGAGISAESGIPTFRGAGGYWRKYHGSSLATPEAFRSSPSLVWEFYHYRREVAAKAQPNSGLAGRGAPDPNIVSSDIPIKSLPHCKKQSCGGLLRPHIVWFGENLEPAVLQSAEEAMSICDVCLVVGTSSVVYPAAMFAPQAAARGAVVAEFNLEPTPATPEFHYYFEGPCGTTVPQALAD